MPAPWQEHQKDVRVRRLGDERIEPAVSRTASCLVVSVGCHSNQTSRQPTTPQLRRDPEAVEAGQADVTQHYFGAPLLGRLDPLRTRVGDPHFVPIQRQQEAETPGRVRVVLYY